MKRLRLWRLPFRESRVTKVHHETSIKNPEDPDSDDEGLGKRVPGSVLENSTQVLDILGFDIAPSDETRAVDRSLFVLRQAREIGGLKLSTAEFGQLVAEVLSGDVSFELRGRRKVQRVVTVDSVQLKRQDGKVMVHLGSWTPPDHLVHSCAYPCGRRDYGVEPRANARKVLELYLNDVVRNVKLVSASTSNSLTSSPDQYGITTLVIETVHEARLGTFAVATPPCEQRGRAAQPARALPTWLGESSVIVCNAAKKHCGLIYINRHKDDGAKHAASLYGWMPPTAFEVLRAGEGERDLADIHGAIRTFLAQQVLPTTTTLLKQRRVAASPVPPSARCPLGAPPLFDDFKFERQTTASCPRGAPPLLDDFNNLKFDRQLTA